MSTKQTNRGGARHSPLGEFEHMLLLAILQLGDDAYAPAVSALLEEEAGRSVSRGALYSSLGRLESKGFVRWRLDEPGPERGGHARRRFAVTAPGVTAVRAYRAALERLWSNLDAVLGEQAG